MQVGTLLISMALENTEFANDPKSKNSGGKDHERIGILELFDCSIQWILPCMKALSSLSLIEFHGHCAVGVVLVKGVHTTHTSFPRSRGALLARLGRRSICGGGNLRSITAISYDPNLLHE